MAVSSSRLQIRLDADGPWFQPGSSIVGEVRWRGLDADVEALDLRLFWYTEGKGTQDVGLATSRRIARPGSSGSRRFALAVPEGPYSFSGRLITLAWALELVALPGRESVREDLLIGPRPVEVDLRRGVDSW
jgi:hypothetical protein